MPKLIQYRDKCIGCGVCQEMQPDMWRMSKMDGKATLLQAEIKKGIYIATVHSSSVTISKQVIEACPPRVIKLV